MSEFTLVPLDCPSCGAGIRADGEDLVFYCTACRNGYRFDAEALELMPIEVSFVSLPSREVDFYLPFWRLPASVTIHERSAQGSTFGGLIRFFLGVGEQSSTGGEGAFAVPAFHTSLAVTTELTRRYTEALPMLGDRLAERLIGGSYGIDDARKLAHYALVASEVEKSDTLTQLRYDIEFGQESLLGVPFVRTQSGVEDAVFGVSLRARRG